MLTQVSARLCVSQASSVATRSRIPTSFSFSSRTLQSLIMLSLVRIAFLTSSVRGSKSAGGVDPGCGGGCGRQDSQLLATHRSAGFWSSRSAGSS